MMEAVGARVVAERRDLVVDGYRHHVASWAPDGPPIATLLALHGFGVTGWRTYRYVAPQLAARGVRTVAPDLLGFGQSDRPDGVYALRHYARLTAALADALELDRPILAGHSLGGKIAAGTAACFPDHFAGLVLINPGGFAPFDRALTALAGSPPARWLLQSELFAHRLLPRTPFGVFLAGADDVEALRRLSRSHHALDLDYTGLRRRFADLTLPTLVLWGRDDPMLPRAAAHRAARSFPHARLRWIADAGHAPMKDQPEAVVEAVSAFAQRQSDRHLNRRSVAATDPA